MRHVLCYILFLTAMMATTVVADQATDAELAHEKNKMHSGWLEKVQIHPGGLVLHASLTPSARSSTLKASEIEFFKKKKQEWVRFDLTDRHGKTQKFERAVLRTARFKRSKGESVRRPVVHLQLCLGKISLQTEVSLNENKESNYDLVLGQNFIAGILVIDPSISFSMEPNCPPFREK